MAESANAAKSANTTAAVKKPDPAKGFKQSEDVLMAMNLYAEARSESDEGIYGVANVVRNRVNATTYGWPNSFSGVIMQKYQFSWTNNLSDPNTQSALYAKEEAAYNKCYRIGQQVMQGGGSNPIGGCDHYCTNSCVGKVSWAQPSKVAKVIGNHSFFNFTNSDDAKALSADASKNAQVGNVSSSSASQTSSTSQKTGSTSTQTASSSSSSKQSGGSVGVGSKVRITGSKYATGQSIPNWVKQNTYTVSQISGSKALIKEIVSWVYINDLQLVSGGVSSSSTTSSSSGNKTSNNTSSSGGGTIQQTPNTGKSSLATESVNFGTINSNPRNEKVSKITIHHMAGNIGAKSCANMHKNGSASANYYIGTDGTICSGVAENRRAWTSSSGANDHKAITYEVANNAGEPNWTISAAAYKSMIALSRDICSRYGISPHFDGSASGSLTAHYMFASTACPGPYIKGKLKDGTIENDIKNGISSGNNAQNQQSQKTQTQQSQTQQSQKTQTQNQTSEQTYVVKSGDTLGGIAAKFNVSGGYMTLANYNHISNPNVISVGQVIKIPGSKTAASSNSTTAKSSETQTSTSAQTKKEENKAAADITYVVKSGDTLGAIAAKFGVSGGYQRLATYNGIANPNCISVGQVIKIPSSSSAVTAGGTQTAQVSGGSVKGDAKLASTAAQVAAEMNSTGWCATGVSRAISRRYNIWLSGNGNQMDDSMIANGNFVQLNLSLAEALKIPGLILTWEATATKLGSIYGHTAITEGNGYASYSDFRESNTLGCSGRTGYKCFVHKNYV